MIGPSRQAAASERAWPTASDTSIVLIGGCGRSGMSREMATTADINASTAVRTGGQPQPQTDRAIAAIGLSGPRTSRAAYLPTSNLSLLRTTRPGDVPRPSFRDVP